MIGVEQQFISESCSWFHTPDNFTIFWAQIEKLSGLGLNRLGIYRECSLSPNFDYFLLDYKVNDISDTFYTGICYSANCTEADLSYMAYSFGTYIPVPYHDLNITRIPPHSLQWTTSFIIIIALLSLYGLICCLAAAMESYHKWKRVGRRKIIDVFSFVHSFNMIHQRNSSNQRIKLMAGVRACAFIFMCVYNTSSILLKTPSYLELPKIHHFVAIFYYSFDLWLFVSGFFLAFDLSRNWQKIHSFKLVALMFIRKAIKVFILNAIVCLGVKYLLIPTGSGPLWNLLTSYYHQNCESNYLRYLMISNFSSSSCDHWLWIWHLDVQLAFVGCIIFAVFKSGRKWRLPLCMFLQLLVLASGFMGVTWLMGEVDYKQGLLQGNASKWPITRGIAYLIGFNVGYWYFSYRAQKSKEKLLLVRVFQHRIIRVLVPLIGFCIIFISFLYCLKWLELFSPTAQKYLLQTQHFTIPLGFALLLSSGLLGFKGFVYILFDDKFFNLISRLSFSAYAMQYMIVTLLMYSRTEDIYINLAKTISYCSCTVLASLATGFFFCVMVELPVHKFVEWALKGEGDKYIEFQ